MTGVSAGGGVKSGWVEHTWSTFIARAEVEILLTFSRLIIF